MTFRYWLRLKRRKLAAFRGRKKRAGVPRKVADRPHWLTVIIGLVSPALALVAIGISLNSLAVSERNMKVGQRAYLTIRNARALTGLLFGDLPLAKPACQLGVVHLYEVHNLGRTPGSVVGNVQSVTYPDEWIDVAKSVRQRYGLEQIDEGNGWRGAVSQDSNAQVGETFSFQVPYDQCKQIAAYIEFSKAFAKDNSLRADDVALGGMLHIAKLHVRGWIAFKDVFGDTYPLRWSTQPTLSIDGAFDALYIQHLERSTNHMLEKLLFMSP